MTPLRFHHGIAAALAAVATAILFSGASAETGRRAVTLSALPTVEANALDSKLDATLRLVVERAEASRRATISGAKRDPLEFVFDARSPFSVLRDPRR